MEVNMPKKKRLFLSPPHMSGNEQQRIAEVFETNYIAPVGPHLAMFEEDFAEFVGVKHAVALGSGTAALHLALLQLDLQPDDEVLCSSLTFIASANPILYERGRPVFIDADWTSWNLDPNLVEEELVACARMGKLPKAIIVVDLLGQSADMDALENIAGRYDVPIIDDAAEALGATYRGRPVGSGGWCSTFSFNGNKIITTSGGGMLCSNDESVVEQARYLSTQSRQPLPYYHHTDIGYNYRMSNILAAVGLAQLEVLPQRVEAKRKLFAGYRAALADIPGLSFMPEADYGEPNCWLSTMLVDPQKFGATCEELRQAMEAENVEARRVWKPMHCQPVFAGCRVRGGAVSEQIFDQGISLPSGTAMTEDDCQRVVDVIRQTHAKMSS
jgi:dTDP-4-amino-4,6-dideoxygalactose transaminase